MPTKTRPNVHRSYRNGEIFGEFSGVKESISWDPIAPRKAICFHWKLQSPFSGVYCVDPDKDYRYSTDNYVGDYGHVERAAKVAFEKLYNLKGYTLPGQSGFEILTFAADFDSTLKMIGDRFKSIAKAAVIPPRTRKQAIKKAGYVLPSYGEATWGWIPFVSDMKSGLKGLVDYLADKGQSPYCQVFNVVRDISHENPRNPLNGSPSLKIGGTMRTHGELCVAPPAHLKGELLRAMRMLDSIGFNPDLKSAWDVIPLSFVVDYFIPVGDLLESLHPRGWVNYDVSGGGWSSYEIAFETSYWEDTLQFREHPDWYITSPIIRGEVYSRGRAAIPTSSVKTAGQHPTWEAPSFRELFNTAYLSNGSRR